MNLSVRENLNSQEIDGELVILDKDNGKIHQLNAVASTIWQYIETGLDLNAISNKLVEAYEIDEVTAKADLKKVLQQFKELKLINGDLS